MPNCMVFWCENKGIIPGVHYFNLTKARHDVWMRALKRDPTVERLGQHNVVCSKHFNPEDLYFKGSRIRLKPNATPKLCLERQDEISQRTLREVQNIENIRSNENPSPPQEIEMDENMEVLYFDKENSASLGFRVSGTPTVEIATESPVSVATSSSDSPMSFKRVHGDSSTDSEGNKGPIKRIRRDIKKRHNYSASPASLLRKLKNESVKKTLARKKIKGMKAKIDRLEKRVKSLRQIITSLKQEEMVSENGFEILEKSISGVPLSLMKRNIKIKKRGSKGKKLREKFSEDLKTFAMTLQFLSSKAYLYVRNVFDLALPAPSTIRQWLSKINCEPGFCENSFNSLKLLVAERQHKNQHTLCSLMLDEMAIKKQIEVRNMKTWGYEDYGTGLEGDSLKYAMEALVLIVHVDWRSQKMKVNLAAQTLSASVADSLEFLSKDMQHPDFKDAGPSIEFIRIIDRLFDFLNSRNPFGKGYKAPLRKSNEFFWKPLLEESFIFLKSLKHINGELLSNSKNKTPILGFCTTIKSIIGIYDEHIKKEASTLRYLLTYKFSQDHLELFFCAIRGRNGWNNNPTAFQFYYTFRRLCMKIDLKVLKGNCEILDDTNLLASSNSKENCHSIEFGLDDISIVKKYDLDLNDFLLEVEGLQYEINILPSLTLLTENVVTYISGYVVRSVCKQISCTICLNCLEESDHTSVDMNVFKLIHRKDRGGLIKPSKDVIKICQYVEKKIRQVLNITDNLMPTEKNFLENFILRISTFLYQEEKLFKCLDDHIFDYSPYGINHTMRLIKSIVRVYCKIRFYKVARRQTETIRGEMKRQKLTKLVLFSHQ